jgi:hypothetical protein
MRSIVAVIRRQAEGRDEERPTLRVAPGLRGPLRGRESPRVSIFVVL